MKFEKLQFITDGHDVDSTVAQATAAIDGGCRWVQIRMKSADDNDVVEAARRILPAARRNGAVVVIDDRVHLVKPTGVDGVHLGKEDMPPAEARAILGPGSVIGVTVNSLDDILAVDHAAQCDSGSYPSAGIHYHDRIWPFLVRW